MAIRWLSGLFLVACTTTRHDPADPADSRIPDGAAVIATPDASPGNPLPPPGNPNDVLTTDGTSPSWANVRTVLATGDDAGLLVKGTYAGTASTPPATGQGSRMMWYPQRSAFRAGHVDWDQWDDLHVGNQSVAFGDGTIASAWGAAAFGIGSEASGAGSTATGGNTRASGVYATAMGESTQATAPHTTAIGWLAVATANEAIAIGNNVFADGGASTVMGSYASSNHHVGAFVFGDGWTSPFNAVADREFAVRASGGVRFITNDDETAGVTLGAGAGSWTMVSDRNAKRDFRDVDGAAALAKIAAMSIQSWHYKAEASGALHIGPVAQDFRAAFGLGDSDKTITTGDIAGVNMLAIQALARENAELRARLDKLERRLDRTRDR